MSEASSSSVKPKELLRAIVVFSAAMVMGVFIFMLITVFVIQLKAPSDSVFTEYQDITTWIMAAISLICLVIAWQTFRKGVAAAKNSLNSLNDKLTRYRSSLIRYMAICEAPTLANIIVFMLTGNFVFLVFASVLLGFMLAAMPITRRVVSALELDWSQQQELE
jgi:hypothetical protein